MSLVSGFSLFEYLKPRNEIVIENIAAYLCLHMSRSRVPVEKSKSTTEIK